MEFNDYGTRLPYFDLSRPVTSWKVTVTRVATGAVITTRTGGAASTGIGIHWDGYLPNRKRALSGTYRATLTATAGGVTSTAGSAIFGVQCGAPLLHSYECSGVPAVLVVRPGDGRGHWLIARYDRLPFWDQGYTENWSVGWAAGQVNAIVPFGDVNQDFHNDLVVRKADGTLWAHMGIGQSHFGGRQTVKLGSGWNKSDLLFTSGDLTGDGIADLLARDRATGYLYRLNGTGKKSFTAPVRLAGAYKGYTRMLGPGDINSDGRADLLAVDGQGALYGMPGNGNGTFGTIRRIGGGMKAYNAVIGAGDVNQDGRNDLIVRDSAGTLHRLLGTGKGTFGAPQKVGAARNMYLF